jgi:hypothetical protein
VPFKRAARHQTAESVDVESRLEPFVQPTYAVVVAERHEGGHEDQDR